MKLGLLCRADNIGLGAQTWELHRHLNPHKALVIDLSSQNKNKQYFERFPRALVSKLIPRRVQVMNFVSGLNTFFTCETPYNYEFFLQCKKRRVKSLLQYNWEFLDYLPYPRWPRPDVLLSPSYWHLDEARINLGAVYLPVPVNRDILPFERKTGFKRFLHLAGIRVDHDRNGTVDTLKAFKLIEGREDIKLTVKCQNPGWAAQWQKEFGSPNIEILSRDTVNYWENYSGYDCLLFPRKYGGLCLPMQEALSKGMPVIMTDVCPNDKMLPKEWLIESSRTGDFEARTKIDIYSANIGKLANKILDLADMNEAEAGAESDKANALAEALSWKTLLPEYQKILV